MVESEPILRVKELSVGYGPTLAVDALSFDVHAGEILGIAGESGSGKSTVVHAIARTLRWPAVIRGGEVWLGELDLLGLGPPEMQRVRWKELAIVFQSALNALNPVLRVVEQICDVIHCHEAVSREAASSRARELLSLVGVDPVHLTAFPHQLSGGMRQRVVLAIALALGPKLLLLDEPTTALDVVVQRSILDRIQALRRERGFAVVLVSHDLPLLFDVADRVLVLYAGRLAEVARARALAETPRHPYSEALVASAPSAFGPKRPLQGIPGRPPVLSAMPEGCRFHPRCPRSDGLCSTEPPPTPTATATGWVCCHHPLP